MPELSNSKHEQFAQFIALGKPVTEAYVLAGYKPHKANPTRLRDTPTVDRRIEELLRVRYSTAAQVEVRALEKASERVAVSKGWVLERLKENVERAMTIKPVLDKEGNQTGVYTYEGAVANRALELLGKELGMFIDRSKHVHRHEVEFSSLPPEQREAKAKELIDRAKRLLALRDERKAREAAAVIEGEAKDVSLKSENEDAPPG